MIAKITRGKDIGGLVRYLLGPGKGNEHTGQRVIASCETVDVRLGVTLDKAEIAALGRRLDAPRADFGKEVNGGHVWHLSLTNRVDDQHLSDEQWAEIARGAMTAMGFTEASGKAPCRWVAVAHGPSTEGNEHVHLAVSLVREDGTVASIWRDRVAMSRYCAQVERAYDLMIVHQAPGVGMPGVTRGEQERARREGRAEPDRTRLARVVRAASVASETEAEFVRRLRRSGAMVRPRYAEGGRDRVVGYSVALRPHGGHQPVWYGGGKLAADLTLPRLREFWEASPQETAAAVTEWRGIARPPAGARERTTDHPHRWYAAAEAVEAAYQALVEVPIDDTAAWAGVAREAAGVLAAWSGRVEPDRPGPFARTADVLSRSAQTPRRGPHTRAAAPGLRGVAGFVVQAMLAWDSAQGWVALLGQLARLADTIAKVHAARGERWQAERVAALAAGELRAASYQDHGDQVGALRLRELVEVGSRRSAPQQPAPRRPVSPGEHAAAARWHERQQGRDRGVGR